MSQARKDDVLDHTDLIQATVAVRNPATSAAELAAITSAQPTLWAEIARHPNAYPALLDWFDQVGDDAVRQAVAARRAGAQATPTPPQTPGSDAFQQLSFTPAQTPPLTRPTNAIDWASPTPEPQTDQPAKKRTGLMIGVAAVVVALALVAWFIVRPALSPTGPGEGRYAPDITSEPTSSQPVDLFSIMDQAHTEYYTVTINDPATEGVGLAYIDVDYARRLFEVGHTWYEGYEEDYDHGYTDGVACSQAPEPDDNSYQELYWTLLPAFYCLTMATPTIGVDELYDDPSHSGYEAGYDDGVAGTRGAHQAERPDPLDETSKIVGFSLTDGSILWTFDLALTGLAEPQAVGAITTSTDRLPNQAHNLSVAANGQGRVALIATDHQDVGGTPWMVVLDAGAGSVVSMTALQPGDYRVAGYHDSTVFAWSMENPAGPATMTAYSDDGATLWTHDSTLLEMPTDRPAQVIADTWVEAGDEFVNLADGRPGEFGSDITDSVQYFEASDQSVYRVSGSLFSGGELMKWDPRTNTARWSKPVPVGTFVVTPDSTTAYDVTVSTLTAYRLSDGKRLWTQDLADLGTPIAANNSTVAIVIGGLLTDTEVDLISTDKPAATGTTVTALDVVHVFCGRTTMYVHQLGVGGDQASFDAFDTSATQAAGLWSLPLIGADDSFDLIGDVFVTTTATGELSILG